MIMTMPSSSAAFFKADADAPVGQRLCRDGAAADAYSKALGAGIVLNGVDQPGGDTGFISGDKSPQPQVAPAIIDQADSPSAAEKHGPDLPALVCRCGYGGGAIGDRLTDALFTHASVKFPTADAGTPASESKAKALEVSDTPLRSDRVPAAAPATC